MAQSSVAPSHPHARDAYHVHRVPVAAPFAWVAAGWRDVIAAPLISLTYGLVFVFAGLILAGACAAAHLLYLFLPLCAGFMLVGPAASLGLYAIAREQEAGHHPTPWIVLRAFRANPGPILYVGIGLLAVFLVWFRIARLVFAAGFPDAAGIDAASLAQATLFTHQGQMFLALALSMGAIGAALVFGGAAFALPLLVDRPAGTIEAVSTSWIAVEANIPAMLVWAGLLVVLVAAGMAAALVGLAVTLPVAGYATWHGYRAIIPRPIAASEAIARDA